MQKIDSRGAEPLLVVAILLAKINYRTDPVLARELIGPLRRKAAADSQMIGQPVEIGLPFGLRGMLFGRFDGRRHHVSG